jgi:hypothetical protein
MIFVTFFNSKKKFNFLSYYFVGIRIGEKHLTIRIQDL